jgi:DNA-binding NtrC family response regulator
MTTTDTTTTPKAILILDDEGDIVFIFKKALELAGYDVFAFTDPELALEHLVAKADRYGLVISDIRMPKMDGREFVEKARALSPSISIILMSAFSMTDLNIPSEAKIAELIQKPITPIKLKEIVSKYVKPVPKFQST